MDDDDYFSDEDIFDDQNQNSFSEDINVDDLLIETIVKMKMFCRGKNEEMFSSRNTFELVKQFYTRQIISK